MRIILMMDERRRATVDIISTPSGERVDAERISDHIKTAATTALNGELPCLSTLETAIKNCLKNLNHIRSIGQWSIQDFMMCVDDGVMTGSVYVSFPGNSSMTCLRITSGRALTTGEREVIKMSQEAVDA